MREKFAAKFPEAGNLKLQEVSQFLTSSLRAAALTSIVFHSIFPQAVPVVPPERLKPPHLGRVDHPDLLFLFVNFLATHPSFNLQGDRMHYRVSADGELELVAAGQKAVSFQVEGVAATCA